MSNNEPGPAPSEVVLKGKLAKLPRITVKSSSAPSAKELRRTDVAYGVQSTEQMVHAFDVRKRANEAS